MDKEPCACGVYIQMKRNSQGSKGTINKYVNSGGDLGIEAD